MDFPRSRGVKITGDGGSKWMAAYDRNDVPTMSRWHEQVRRHLQHHREDLKTTTLRHRAAKKAEAEEMERRIATDASGDTFITIGGSTLRKRAGPANGMNAMTPRIRPLTARSVISETPAPTTVELGSSTSRVIPTTLEKGSKEPQTSRF